MTAFTSATGEPVNNTDNVGRVPSLKLSKFRGKDGENVLAWLHQVDRYFLLNCTKEHEKVALVTFALRDDAGNFAHYLVINNNGVDPTWQEFRHVFIRKYETPAIRGDLLRDKLKALTFPGPH